MIKRIFILCTLLLATAYLILAVTTFNSKPADQVCKGMELTVKDSIDYGFVTDKEVKEILKKGKIYPEGKQLSSINVRQLEEFLSNHPFSKMQSAILHQEARWLLTFIKEFLSCES